MTREEAIRILDGLKPNTAIAYGNETAYIIGQALTMAIKALEQNESAEEWYKLFVEKLEQEPKTGHWIKHDNGSWWECSECHAERAYGNEYCPDCGSHNGDIAKMVEPQESEDDI